MRFLVRMCSIKGDLGEASEAKQIKSCADHIVHVIASEADQAQDALDGRCGTRVCRCHRDKGKGHVTKGDTG